MVKKLKLTCLIVIFSKGVEKAGSHTYKLISQQRERHKAVSVLGSEPALKPNKSQGTCPAAFRAAETLIYSAGIIEELSFHSAEADLQRSHSCVFFFFSSTHLVGKCTCRRPRRRRGPRTQYCATHWKGETRNLGRWLASFLNSLNRIH